MSRRRRAGNRINQIMAAHLQEAAIVGALAADEDRLHRRLHVVVDAPRAGALKEPECPVVGIEHHLLRLARIPQPRQRLLLTLVAELRRGSILHAIDRASIRGVEMACNTPAPDRRLKQRGIQHVDPKYARPWNNLAILLTDQLGRHAEAPG